MKTYRYYERLYEKMKRQAENAARKKMNALVKQRDAYETKINKQIKAIAAKHEILTPWEQYNKDMDND